MKDINKQVEETLSTVLPTYYELFLDSQSTIPCISYQVTNNFEESKGNELCWDRIIVRVKLWVTTVGDMCSYSSQIDDAIAVLGPFTRSSAYELSQGELICRIVDYSILIPETYSTMRYL